MDVTKTTEPKNDSRRQYVDLNKRYGKIGIPAVVAALRQHDEPCNENETRTVPDERD